MLTMKQLLLLLLLPITGWALKCRVCWKGKKAYDWRGGLFGGECGKDKEGWLVDFDNKGKNGENVSCLHFTDGIRSWRGAINKTIEDKCYFNMPSFFTQRMYCICNTDDCNSNSAESACDCSQCKAQSETCEEAPKVSKATKVLVTEIDERMMRTEGLRKPTPSFFLNPERSFDNSPSVAVTFPDGYQDTLNLRQFFTNEKDKVMDESNTCAYIGHLEREPGACVAMTGCYGKEDVEFSIASKHSVGSGLYKWTLNGDVEIIQHSASKGVAKDKLWETKDQERETHKPVLKGDGLIEQNNMDLDLIFEELCSRQVDWICAIHADAEYNQNSNCVQKSHTLEYKVIFDDGMYDEFGSDAPTEIQKIMAHVSTKFCHESLGTKIQLQMLGEMKHMVGHRWESSAGEMWNSWDTFPNFAPEERGEADMLIAFGKYDYAHGYYLGVAYLDATCQNPDDSYNLNFFETKSFASTAWTLAHEMGHNLGMYHDFSEWPSPPHLEAGCDRQGWMSYQLDDGIQQWSECSKNDFAAHYSQNRDIWCMPESEIVCGGEDGSSGCDLEAVFKGGWWKMDEHGECSSIEEINTKQKIIVQ